MLLADLIELGDGIATDAAPLGPRMRSEKRGAGANDAGFRVRGRSKRQSRRKCYETNLHDTRQNLVLIGKGSCL